MKLFNNLDWRRLERISRSVEHNLLTHSEKSSILKTSKYRLSHRPHIEINDQRLSRQVRRRIEAGDVRSATRLVINEGRVVVLDDESANILRDKHPTKEKVEEPENRQR